MIFKRRWWKKIDQKWKNCHVFLVFKSSEKNQINWTLSTYPASSPHLHTVWSHRFTRFHIFSHGLICCHVSDGGRLRQHVPLRDCERAAASHRYFSIFICGQIPCWAEQEFKYSRLLTVKIHGTAERVEGPSHCCLPAERSDLMDSDLWGRFSRSSLFQKMVDENIGTTLSLSVR